MATLPRLVRIEEDGRVELPSDLREAAGLRAGDTVAVRVLGPGQMALVTKQQMSIQELRRRFGSDEKLDWDVVREAGEQDVADEFMEELARINQ
jgi:bifunctional DNA-binding transcriptional regulator/antitoxin component of YhaV-PrlF toxin-antitoxin module